MDWSQRWKGYWNRDVSPGDEIRMLFLGFLFFDIFVLIPYWLWRKNRPSEFDQYAAKRRTLRFHREPEREKGSLAEYAERQQ